jgi:hypothetical protein
VATRRRTIGAYRWAGVPPQCRSCKSQLLPRRVVEKPPRDSDPSGP